MLKETSQDLEQAREYVLSMVRENDVKFIRLWFTDILGALKGFAITSQELEDALQDGVGFDGASIQGFREDESDMVAMPDPTTFRILPWRPRQNAVARMMCDVLTPKYEPFVGDPRYVLKRNLERAAALGYTYYVGPEMEFFYFKSADSTDALDKAGYFDQTTMDLATDLRRETILTLEEMGIAVDFLHHEAAQGQHEIDLRYSDALNMADSVMTHRLVVKEVAMSHGVHATFMPKPVSGVNGSGMHVHQSLFKGGQNAFYDPNADDRLSQVARQFVAGLMRNAPQITAVTNQWVNSYKRLIPGYEAPVYISWARINRGDLIRVPSYKEGRDEAVRIEYRAPDPACNPYLAFSVMLAAGLEGIEKRYEAPDAVEENVYQMTAEERDRRNIGMLPDNLREAVSLMKQSNLVKESLGEFVFNTFIQNKEKEWDEYKGQVTNYEIERYLPIL